MTATTTTQKRPAALLTTTLGKDGKLKHTLPVREQRKLQAARELCSKLDKVDALQIAASGVCESLDVLIAQLADEQQ